MLVYFVTLCRTKELEQKSENEETRKKGLGQKNEIKRTKTKERKWNEQKNEN